MKNSRGNVLIVIIIIVFIIIGIGVLGSQNILEGNDINIEETPRIIEISEISFNENNIEIDLKEVKTVILNINPSYANKENLEYISTNSQIATIEEDIEKSNENMQYVKIEAVSEGECEVFVTYKEIESNKIKVKVIDSQRIEREKKEAEEKAKKQQENQEKSQTTKSTTNNTTITNQKNNSSSNSNSSNTHGKTVYRTPSGKRYHFDPDCGGKNSYQTTLDAAKSSGLTPCKKCAQ